MNQILHWLAAGDLRSDGLSNEIVGIVLQNPALIADLMEGLVAYYKFDEVGEGLVMDHSGNDLHGAIMGEPEFSEGMVC